MALSTEIEAILERNGFQPGLFDTEGLESVYYKGPIFVNVPQRRQISDPVLEKIMETAEKPEAEYRHLLEL